ncbi:MAG: hypothetical protein GX827_04980 [Clostridiales bacterium]|jgi:hypothetical protein|nr:hypothetical protein [Clostridiales bacterium]
MSVTSLPHNIYSGAFKTPHCQGIAIDTERKYIYFSYTTMLVKTDLSGNLIGSCGGLTGHLGCIDFNDDDGKVYGSLEYKAKKAFYCAIFDVDKIDRPGMSAEEDGIMKTVYLPDVVEDFCEVTDGSGVFDGDTADTPDHRYGCSGIDGTAFGPVFGEAADSPKMLMIAYGIYRNNSRTDNDYQIIVQYDWRRFKDCEKPLNQDDPHKSGLRADEKYFVFTGNTTYGVQNLEYDEHSRRWLMCVYPGKKKTFPNFPLYVIDGAKAPVRTAIGGQKTPEVHPVLSLAEEGIYDEKSGVRGWEWPHGSTGIASLGDGYFYIGYHGTTPEGLSDSNVKLCLFTGQPPLGFEEV